MNSRRIARLAMGALPPVLLAAVLASPAPAGVIDRTVLSADFSGDTVDQPPDTSLPGDPPGDALLLPASPGQILVRASVGTLMDKPITVTKAPGVSSIGLEALLAPAPECGTVALEWRSLLQSPANCFFSITVKGEAGQMIAAVEYRPGGALYYHPGAMLLPVSYTPDMDRHFRITVDLAAHTTGLEVDGVMLAGFQGIPFAYPATAVTALGFGGGCTDELDFALDDIRAVATCPFDFEPQITVPSVIVAEEGGFATFGVTATDPDGEPITSLTADLSGLPPGDASFMANATNDAGTFSWHPLPGDLGLYPITFTASNALSVSGTTQLYVVAAGAAVTGTFLWTPQLGDEGEYDIVFTATNVFNESSTHTTHLTITSPVLGISSPYAPLAPRLALAPERTTRGPIISGAETKEGKAGKELEVTVTAADGGAALAPRLTESDGSGGGIRPAASRSAVVISLTADLTGLPANNNATFHVDGEPVVSAPATVAGQETEAVTVSVGAADPDADPIERLMADLSNLPANHGATFTTNAAKTLGTLSWTPGLGQAGSYVVTFTANNLLVGSASTSIVVSAVLAAETFQWGRDKRVRLSSKRATPWCTYLEPVAGSFDLTDVDYASVVLTSEGTGSVSSIPAISGKTIVVGDRDNDEAPDVRICFTLDNLRLLFNALSGRVSAPVAVEGRLISGRIFRAEAVIDLQGAGSTVEALVAPNPLNPAAVLAVSTIQAGRLRVRLYDTSGRLIRVLRDDYADEGEYRIPIDGRDRSGAPLPSGVYYYRVDSGEQVTTGRLSILK